MSEVGPVVSFHDAAGRVIAKTTLPPDALIEGELGSVKEFDVKAVVTVAGKLDHYIVVSPDGTTVKGAVLERRGNHALPILLNAVDLKPGQQLEGKWQVITTKD